MPRGLILVSTILAGLYFSREASAQAKAKEAPKEVRALAVALVEALRLEDREASQNAVAKLCHPILLAKDKEPRLDDDVARWHWKKAKAAAIQKIPRDTKEIEVRWEPAKERAYRSSLFEATTVYFWHGRVKAWVILLRKKVDKPEEEFAKDPYRGWRIGQLNGM